MMAWPFLSAHNHGLALFQKLRSHGLIYTCVREYARNKKYDYDLDALIDWKNKTNLVFGGPRTLTKTGKIRKSKANETEELRANMELLSAQANHFKPFEIDYEPSVVFDDVRSSIMSPTEGLSGDSFLERVPPGLTNDIQSSIEMFQKEKPTALNHLHDVPDASPTELFETEIDSMTSFRRKSYAKRNNTDEDYLQIPVISPIPSGNYSAPKSYNDTRLSSLKSEKQKLPTEPPDSFSFINCVPLSFSCSEIEKDFGDTRLRFSEDVKALSLRKVPSVKSILNKTMPDLNRFFLNRWREKMIAELGEEGFKVHQEATIKRGVNFHANVMELLSGKSESEIQIMPDNEGHWASLQTAMKFISGVEALEEDMQHPALLYRGIADCVAMYKDVLCVIDWKTSKKPRPLLKNTYDDPLQVAAYIGLICANKEQLKIKGVNHGLLVIIYPDGSPAHIHLMNESLCEQYWQDWLGRLYNYYQLVYTEKHGTC